MPGTFHQYALEIGFVLTPAMLTTGTALPYEMWAAADDRRRARRRNVRSATLRLVSASEDLPARFGRLPITPDCALEDCPDFDVVYLPALWRNPARTRAVTARLGPWLVDQYERGAHIAAVGTGVSLLAASGLLDGKAATTHWHYFERFEREFPRVDLKRQFFITQSGSLYCAASINSLADVTVNLIERAYDRATAHHVERNFSHEIRRTYEEYRYLDGGTSPLDDELVVEAQVWIESNLSAQITVAELAARLGVSSRTLNRRFHVAVGSSPRSFWQRRRVLLAKEFLENTNLTISEIAYRVGYEDAGHFARLFEREMSVTPSGYRQTVRAKLFRAGAPESLGVKQFNTEKK
jgi:transcriptional regulator GlxA family with amidase domain